MFYEINISKDGTHFFATAPRSIQTTGALIEVFSVLDYKFPETEGYKLMIRFNPETSICRDLNEIRGAIAVSNEMEIEQLFESKF
jgi:hypothetical protein